MAERLCVAWTLRVPRLRAVAHVTIVSRAAVNSGSSMSV